MADAWEEGGWRRKELEKEQGPRSLRIRSRVEISSFEITGFPWKKPVSEKEQRQINLRIRSRVTISSFKITGFPWKKPDEEEKS